MTRPLDLDSERFSPYGNVAAEGILNQLGRPNLDMLSVLIRETVQNSWDARLSDNSTVRFGVSITTLSDAQLDLLRNVVFASEPEYLALKPALSSEDRVHAMFIYDRGATGLDGPTRADRSDDDTSPRRFVNFFRNIGLSPDKYLGGGTYGYGKSILYRISRIHTICVHTHCKAGTAVESRFLAASLHSLPIATQEYRQYTGRHWWGRLTDGVIEPVKGHEADELAKQLGFPHFSTGEMGTTCLILLPSLDMTPDQAIHRIAEILLWNCWPKMIENTHGVMPMSFELLCEGQPVNLPAPDSLHPLNGFVQAMTHLKGTAPQDTDGIMYRVTSIGSQRPRKHLGRLALQQFVAEEYPAQQTSDEDIYIPIPGRCHHVALMRNAELVVKYLAGDPPPVARVEYAGVFLVDEAVDNVFARAEPPTHDDWQPHFLTERHEKTFVRKAIEEVRRAVTLFTTPQPTAGRDSELVPLGAFADHLGRLLLAEEGPGGYVPLFDGISNLTRRNQGDFDGNERGRKSDPAGTILERGEIYGTGNISDGTSPSGPGTSRSPEHAKITLAGEGRLVVIDEVPVFLTAFRIEHLPGSPATRVEVEVHAVLDNGDLEHEPPASSSLPEVLLWIAPDGRRLSGSEAILIPASDTGIWTVGVSVPETTLINVTLNATGV